MNLKDRLDALQKLINQVSQDLTSIRIDVELGTDEWRSINKTADKVHELAAANGIAQVISVPVKPAPLPKEELVINEEWQRVLDLLEHGTGHVFVTGPGGTGKSTLLERFQSTYPDNLALVAPTGVAALRVGGMTIHRFFGFPGELMTPDLIESMQPSKKERFNKLRVLLVDEISMVRADLMDAIEQFLRMFGPIPGMPFGGVRLIMFGDLYQLPPVSKDADEKRYLKNRYGSTMPYFFAAECWQKHSLTTVTLNTIFRQQDQRLVDALNAIRDGSVTSEHIALINSRVNRQFQPPKDELWITLTTTNDSAKQLNDQMLNKLTTPAKSFYAEITEGFNRKDAPTEEILTLKAGAAVMFIRNDFNYDGRNRWVNGTLGRVVSVEPILSVEVNGMVHEVSPEKWDQIKYEYDSKTKKITRTVTGSFTQMPLKLAAAITVHKAQGLTLDRCVIDLPTVFSAGQSYVALSRCKTLEGMVLRKPFTIDDVIVSSDAKAFMSPQFTRQMRLTGEQS